MSRSPAIVVPLLLTPLLALTGCSGGSGVASADSVVGPAGGTVEAGGSTGPGGTAGGTRFAGPAADGAGTPAYRTPATPAGQPDPAVIRSAAMLLGVDDIDAAHRRLLAAVESSDGSVVSESVGTNAAQGGPLPDASDGAGVSAVGDVTTAGSGVASTGNGSPATPALPTYRYLAGRWVDVTFTVPQGRYRAAVTAVRQIGQVADFAQTADDVTATVADLEARTTTARASIARITALMDRAEKIGDILALESELTNRTADLESLQARSRALAAQTATSTIRVHLVTAAALAAAEPATSPAADTWWSKLGDAFLAAWSGLALVVAATSPVWLLGGVAVAVAWGRLRRSRGRRAVPGAATTTE